MHDNDVEPATIDPCGLFFTREATDTSVTLAYDVITIVIQSLGNR